jgi:hypothetical protein
MAAARNASFSDMVREALKVFVKPSNAELWEMASRLRKKIGTITDNSTDIIREWRDNDEPYR